MNVVDVDGFKFIDEPNLQGTSFEGYNSQCLISATVNGVPTQIYVPKSLLESLIVEVMKPHAN